MTSTSPLLLPTLSLPRGPGRPVPALQAFPPLPSPTNAHANPIQIPSSESNPDPASESEITPLSLLQGPVDPPLVDLTLSSALDLQCKHFPTTREFLIFPWTGTRWSFSDLDRESSLLARGLLSSSSSSSSSRSAATTGNVPGNAAAADIGGSLAGIGPGDRVGIMAGNCEQYVSLLFAVAKLGGILVILNNTYTADEAIYGLKFTECKLFFTTRWIGRLDNQPLIDALAAAVSNGEDNIPELVILRGSVPVKTSPTATETVGGRGDGTSNRIYKTYSDFIAMGSKLKDPDSLASIEGKVLSHQVCNLQFTSGTTGHPKAAMLTHHNLINNARFIADRMNLSPSDTLCCPPPLFHCFGLVLGLLACLVSGAKIVYPAETFDPAATMSAIVSESCTALHGVPTMIDALFAISDSSSSTSSSTSTSLSSTATAAASTAPALPKIKLRTGIVAGAPVPRSLVQNMLDHWSMTDFTSSYGLTEASPTVFNSFSDDPLLSRLTTVGHLMPHARAKIVDPADPATILPLGRRGELCVSGYQLQAGYWNNSAKTAEVMRYDPEGTLWLHTGDEAEFDAQGRCRITGRLKDIVIKGGENVYPAEIEERLLSLPGVARAIVVGVKDRRYGEVVGAFLEKSDHGGGSSGKRVVSDEEAREWVRRRLGRHKAPSHVFWLGEEGVPRDVPLTGSGKVKKFEMARLAEEILKRREVAKL